MGLQSLKVTTKALQQIEEILEIDPNGREVLQTSIVEIINKLHTKATIGEAQLLLVDSKEFTVAPKDEFKASMSSITGRKGPYKVTKTYKSWVGISDGIYEIEDCGRFVPVFWFVKKEEKSRLPLLSILLAIGSILQTGLLFLLIL